MRRLAAESTKAEPERLSRHPSLMFKRLDYRVTGRLNVLGEARFRREHNQPGRLLPTWLAQLPERQVFGERLFIWESVSIRRIGPDFGAIGNGNGSNQTLMAHSTHTEAECS